MVRPGPRDPSERRTLVVGRGISVQGVVQDAERLVVEGTVEATMIHATELSIAPGGVFKGEVEVEDAEIAGLAPLALQHAKRVLNDDGSIEEASPTQRELFDKAWGSQDVIEAQVA